MASSVTRFEVLLPNVDFSDTQTTNALSTFISNMNTLTSNKCFMYQTNNTNTYNNFYTFFGYLTTSQQATALGYLNTLNSSINPSYSPVLCVVWNGTSQP